MDIINTLSSEFSLNLKYVENIVKLIDDGNTIPFIARYRKELTGSLDDQVLRELGERLEYLRSLEKRRGEISASIKEQEKLTQEIESAIENARTMTELEDIYRPFRPKRRTRATIAHEKGLAPLSDIIMQQKADKNLIEASAAEFINPEKGVLSIEEAIDGALDIIAENISDDAALRKIIRSVAMQDGIFHSKSSTDEDSVYRMYYDYSEPVKRIPGHRVLACDRGEREGILKISVELDKIKPLQFIYNKFFTSKSYSSSLVQKAADDAYARLIFPSIEREVRNELSEAAQENALKLFARNLKQLLLQPPVKGKTVLGLDPAYRTGCKVAVVDPTGKVLDKTVIYPTPPQNKIEEAKSEIRKLIDKHGVEILSIGNGTASKETEMFVSSMIKEFGIDISYMVVSEAGASVYSASKLAAKEFPEYDVSIRSAISIARRLQDPLAELVKIDPKAIGVGQYQHDLKPARLDEALGGVVENCVNSVGVDLNTASVSLLSHISGINGSVANNIVSYREENGAFKSRKDLLKVAKLGPKAFEQCAGFLRIPESDNVLDNTSVHPESYDAAKKLLDVCELNFTDIKNGSIRSLKEKVSQFSDSKLASSLGVGVPTLNDIIAELMKPGRDPRDELPPPLLRTDILDMKDLKSGMELFGTVRNVIDFGAFVDIGVHQDGLVHISQICNRFIKHPSEVLNVGDIVKVRILEVDPDRKRISLSMKDI
ncbi:MAG TPA: Tex family protein [Ruminiclostridium sp.]|nr:Tex family protein [Ruminiclostridium sp.]